ncbi:TPA: hypothetical protein EYN65_09015 [Candidatus Poribacteria bacterium]|nr:hypothetical protein [Candidatus Poribacteria bacterium]HIO79883.1 hypothetical protein [Candidatus Poribacteria bacterium]
MIKHNEVDRSFDCEPTLTDSQVLEFCHNGFLVLKGVVDDETNQLTCAYLNGEIPSNPSFIPKSLTNEDLDRIRNSHEPSTLLLERWFIKNVLLNSQLAGALRSLLGKNVGLPVLVSRHTTECPSPTQGWHHDADHIFGPELNFLEVFYYPQDTPEEMGPTEVVPGSHITRTHREAEDKGVSAAGPAGTLSIHSQSILHRKGESTATGTRHMIKYDYWRTVPPQRDWIVEPNFDFQKAHYGHHGTARYIAHMFYWLCGKGEEYRIIGGQGWPWSSVNQIGPSYGFAKTEGYLPNWRKNNSDDYAS